LVCNFARTASRAVGAKIILLISIRNELQGGSETARATQSHHARHASVQEQQNKTDRGKIWFLLTMLRAQVWRDSLLCTLRTCTILHNPAQSCTMPRDGQAGTKEIKAQCRCAVCALCTLPIAFTPLPNRTAPFGMISRAGEFAPEADRLPDGRYPPHLCETGTIVAVSAIR